ncbi:MAG: hypothetical protein H6502_03210 [Candidatus Woesearchaeota archaeon]|nr:MAG: hypothetical protein H6502_03210 [Candidatus Woesearchaeota archaeon]
MPMLSEKREEQLQKMPLIETRVTKSQDNTFVIHKTIITDIKPVKYWEKVIAEEATE